MYVGKKTCSDVLTELSSEQQKINFDVRNRNVQATRRLAVMIPKGIRGGEFGRYKTKQLFSKRDLGWVNPNILFSRSSSKDFSLSSSIECSLSAIKKTVIADTTRQGRFVVCHTFR